MRVEKLIQVLEFAEQTYMPFEPKKFIEEAYQILLNNNFDLMDIKSYIDANWDVQGCQFHWLDNDAFPYLIDLYVKKNWSLRLSIWYFEEGKDYCEDIPHSHFGFIATKALNEIAYISREYKNADDLLSKKFNDVEFKKGNVTLISPKTIHEIVPVKNNKGISIAVRTRGVVDEAIQLDRQLNRIVKRKSSAIFLKNVVMNELNI